MPGDNRSRRREADGGFTLWLEFELWQPMPELGPRVNAFDAEDDFCNVLITLDTGERYALNVWTYKFFVRARQNDHENGDNLGGRYLLPPDLFVERLERPLFEAVVNDLIRGGGLRVEWRVEESSGADELTGAPT